MKVRIIVSAIVVVLFFGSFALAREALTLRGTIDMALYYNPAGQKARVWTQKAELAADQATSAVDFYINLEEQGIKLPYSIKQQIDLIQDQANSGKYLADIGEELTRNQLVLEAQQKYLALLKAKESFKLSDLGFKRAKELLHMAEVAFTAGVVPRSDILGAEAQLAAAEAQLLAAEAGVKNAELDLNKTLGRDLHIPVKLSEPFILPEIGPVDLEKGLEYAMRNRFEILQAREDFMLKKKALKHASENLSPGDSALNMAQLDMQEASLNLRIANDNVTIQVHQLYNALQMQEARLAALEKGVTFSAESFRLARLRYEAGLGIQVEVQGAALSLAELENQLLSARYDHYLSWLQWLFVIGRPVFQEGLK